jgi:hypothetical protein
MKPLVGFDRLNGRALLEVLRIGYASTETICLFGALQAAAPPGRKFCCRMP